MAIETSGQRRVPGLRREEVAMLAGVSLDYYARLEQGRDLQPSDQVIDAIARALRLAEVERTYLHHLVRSTATVPMPDELELAPLDAGMRLMLDSLELLGLDRQLPAWHQVGERTDPSSHREEERPPPLPQSAEGRPQAHQPDSHQITNDRDALHMAPPERRGDAPDDPRNPGGRWPSDSFR